MRASQPASRRRRVPRRARRRPAQRRVARQPGARPEGRGPRRRRARPASPRAVASIRATPGRTTTSRVVADESGDAATAIEHYRAFLRLGAVTHADLAGQVRARLADARRLTRGNVRYPFRRMADPNEAPRDRRPPPRRSHVSAAGRVSRARASCATSASTPRPSATPRRSGRDLAGELEWSRPWDTRARLAAAAREVVRRRPAQRQRQLPRPPRPRRRAATRPRSSGKASPATAAR